jgi:hypothetical protein
VSRLSSKKPKDDGWGIEEAVAKAADQVLEGLKSPLIAVVGFVDIKELKIDPTTQQHEAIVQIRRITAITTPERAREAQTMILKEVAALRGEGAMLPFEEKDILERAFGGEMTGKTVGEQLQDDEEAKIDAELDDDGRLRRHLVAVHDFNASIITDDEATPADLHRFHDADHEKDPADRAWPDHDPEDRMWRRVDLADMLGDAEEPADPNEMTLYEVDGAITDDPNPTLNEDETSIRTAEDVMQENANADDAAGLIPEFRPESDEE